ncbi:protein TusC [Litchfieldella qijiaojingensis]|uniref:Protein TusC n=1 Tax=Litchfieldella qijiaojingensis TaxID=980347 RepID=A0ABQ2YB73_9GAMM|nr:sulfurtransferase complex subunit TusC [Halomonas qijiaojingensis]GGX78639.1 protein TusC [Halomonas qijiaojingensis]
MNDIPEGDLLVILRHGPHGNSWLREGLDAALVAAAFGQRVSLLFLGEGVMALLKDQQEGPLGQKGTQPMLEMLGMYDIETLLVDRRALSERGIEVDDLCVSVSLVEGEAIAGALAHHRQILNF